MKKKDKRVAVKCPKGHRFKVSKYATKNSQLSFCPECGDYVKRSVL